MFSLHPYIVPFVTACIMTPLVYLSLSLSYAQVMQSTNYAIERDSINFAGGLSSSTNYTLEGTAGEVGTGDRTSASYELRGGYQQLDTRFISLSASPDVTLTPSIPGLTGGESNGSTTVTVTTDSPSGYTLSIAGDQSPVLVSGINNIDDYVPGGVNPDYTFTYGAVQSFFGYSPSGVDLASRFKDNGVACNVGTGDTALSCWDGLSTTTEIISQGGSANTPGGATTTVYFRVGIGASASQPEGVYVGTTTLTAVAI